MRANIGYIGYSESVRSHEAKKDGKYPKTSFKKEYSLTERKFNDYLKKEYIELAEWHHTSCKFNRTDFYAWTVNGNIFRAKMKMISISECLDLCKIDRSKKYIATVDSRKNDVFIKIIKDKRVLPLWKGYAIRKYGYRCNDYNVAKKLAEFEEEAATYLPHFLNSKEFGKKVINNI